MKDGELTYDDFLRRLDIQDVLIDAGYCQNRRDGLRYPSYVRIGSDGRRIRGDKFIVTQQAGAVSSRPIRRYTTSSRSSRSTRNCLRSTAQAWLPTGW